MPSCYAKPGTHHARHIDPSVPYHVFTKTLRGEHLLKGDSEVNPILVGVLCRARELWPIVRLYGLTVLDNHLHLKMRGPSVEFSKFVGFFKREVSRRLGIRFKEPGTYWDGRFKSTALPTAESQERCLKYIFANSVKENLVSRCKHWHGLHSGQALATGKPLKGVWFDATSYGRAKRRKNPPKKADFYREKTLTFDQLECWEELSAEEYQAKMAELVREVESEADEVRRVTGKKVMGVRALRRQPRRTRTAPKPPDWFENRRRTICAWVNPNDEVVKQFVKNYYEFQDAFREASERWQLEEPPDFPSGSWAPARAIA